MNHWTPYLEDVVAGLHAQEERPRVLLELDGVPPGAHDQAGVEGIVAVVVGAPHGAAGRAPQARGKAAARAKEAPTDRLFPGTIIKPNNEHSPESLQISTIQTDYSPYYPDRLQNQHYSD